MDTLPHLSWGVLGTGWIADRFVSDLHIDRAHAKARHTVKAIGTSSLEKGQKFADKNVPASLPRPKIYTSYAHVHNDPDVEIVYIATPHVFHKRDCLDAIAAGKHVLCEKPLTINAHEAEEVFSAARAKGVFLMEAVWTRFNTHVRELVSQLHAGTLIGNVQRVFCDFSLPMSPSSLPADSRLRDPQLGAGSLLDIGIYSLMWGSLLLDPGVGDQARTPTVVSSSIVEDGIDVANAIILTYPETKRQAVLSCSLNTKTSPQFCRIEGSDGTVVISGFVASSPSGYTVTPKASKEEVRQVDFPKVGMGLHFEMDAVALDIASGRKQNEDVMPQAETLRMLRMMDSIRQKAGVKYPQDP